MSGSIIKGLFVKLGYDYDESKMKRFDKGVKQTARTLKQTALAAIGLATSIAAIIKSVSTDQRNISRSSKALGIQADIYEGILRTSEQITDSTEAGASILDKLARTKIGVNNGIEVAEGMSRAFGNLGVSLKDLKTLSTPELLFKINSALRGMTEETQRNNVALLGMLDGDSFDFLTTANLRAEVLNNTIKRNRDSFLKFQKEVVKLKQGFFDIFAGVGEDGSNGFIKLVTYLRTDVLPALEMVVKGWNDIINLMDGLDFNSGALGLLNDLVTSIAKGTKSFVEDLARLVAYFNNPDLRSSGSSTLDGEGNIVRGGGKDTSILGGDIDILDKIIKTMEFGGSLLPSMAVPRLIADSIQNNTTNVTNNINIKSTDPKAAGAETSNAINNNLPERFTDRSSVLGKGIINKNNRITSVIAN